MLANFSDTPLGDPKAAQLAELISQAHRILVFTGAGISTASGIPDFRGPGGIWSRRQPVEFADFLASEKKRIEHWDYKLEGHDVFESARPNAAHEAVLELERQGRLIAITTQNIDGLHQMAGSSESLVIELHGTNRWIECLSCGVRREPGPLMEEFRRTRRPPCCGCGGFLKSATISFGQPLVPEVLQRAFAAAADADLVLALGSSLSVHPAASVPLQAAARGIPYAIINRGPTAHDEIASLRLEGDVATILPSVVAEL